MSAYPTDQRCPRCQYPVAPGATTCPNCGLALTGSQPDPYGGQPSTAYGGQGTINSAPTMQSPLYPQSPPSGWGGQQQPGYPPPPPGYTSTQAPTGYGSAPAYPGPGTTPAFPGNQSPGGFNPIPAYPSNPTPPPFSAPPIAPPGYPDAQQKRPPNNTLRIAIIALVVLVILGGGGTVIYLVTRPNPTITITSDYRVGTTPAGSASTTLRVTGTNFSGNSSVTFLLDGQPVPGGQPVQSDSSGNVNTNLTITSDWAMGSHTITARDASGYTTKAGVPVDIVCQGCDNTPGPKGAPTNSASFSLSVTITSKGFGTITETLIITGKGDSGGTVCQSRDDGSTSLSQNGVLNFADGNSFPYTEVSTNQCSGTYVGGQLNYVEMTITDEFDFGNGALRCPVAPHKKQVLTGTFTDATHISGTYSQDNFTLSTCEEKQGSGPIPITGDSGTFTATKN
jgi:hypothetical protein